MKKQQFEFLKKGSDKYGGELLKKRRFRQMGRPISVRHSMHFVLRSSQARGAWSFTRHRAAIDEILKKFARRNGIALKSYANVGNHLHLHIQLSNRHTYKAFIRAISAAIMMKVTGASRWQKFRPLVRRQLSPGAKSTGSDKSQLRFWDLRPFSRIIVGFRALLTITDYITINQHESMGHSRQFARDLIKIDRGRSA